jgi:hypothetical protein
MQPPAPLHAIAISFNPFYVDSAERNLNNGARL